MLSAWIPDRGQLCPTNDPPLWQREISPKAAAESKSERRELRARVAQQRHCRLGTVSLTGAFTLTLAVIKLHYGGGEAFVILP